MTENRCQYCKRTGTTCAEPYLMTDMEQVAALRDCRNAMADSALAAEAKLQAVRDAHPWVDCLDDECELCGVLVCPHNEELHYHHDGCPACDA